MQGKKTRIAKNCEGGNLSVCDNIARRSAHSQAEPTMKKGAPQAQRLQRRQVTAALSAAVTITKHIGDAPNSQAEPTKKKGATQTPAALRERGSGGEALLSEKRPLPRRPCNPL